jgi:TPP-dependent pyruvate/acetoin dehydrogenase alpha subunit
MLFECNPVTVTLRESRDEIASLREFLCNEGFWSEKEEQKTIAKTKKADLVPTLS